MTTAARGVKGKSFKDGTVVVYGDPAGTKFEVYRFTAPHLPPTVSVTKDSLYDLVEGLIKEGFKIDSPYHEAFSRGKVTA